MKRDWVTKYTRVKITNYTCNGTKISESDTPDINDVEDISHFIMLLSGSDMSITTAEDERITHNESRYTKLTIIDEEKKILAISKFKRKNKLLITKFYEIYF